jgi:hypothetical protein
MKITLESTTQIVSIVEAEITFQPANPAAADDVEAAEVASRLISGPHTVAEVPARVWQGTTERGIKVQALIIRIAALADQDLLEFGAELLQQSAPLAGPPAFPLRLIL